MFHVGVVEPCARLPEEWRAALADLGEPGYRAGQIFGWIHRRGVLDPAAMTDLPAALRATLAAAGPLVPAKVDHVHRSDDGTRKLLLRLDDGAAVETVLLPGSRPETRDDADVAAADEDPAAEGDIEPDETVRVTQCISTQVGCAMGCVFCASGLAGLKRHMTPGEIIAQVLLGQAALGPGEVLRNVVFMGMGEPLHNFEGTMRAIRLLTHPQGLGLAPRRLTVSTVGLVPEIRRLAEEAGDVSLAVSLHHGNERRRSTLVPINDKHPLGDLVDELRRWPLGPRRRITIEYTLVGGENDRPEDARELARLLAGLRVKVNLIPMNAIPHSSLSPPEPARVDAFQRVLTDAGYLCFVRRRRGDDVAAACGQLALAGAQPGRAFLRRQPR
jgi:23S rRNA (adenine2503-C2)-methyltransferase